MTSRKSTRWNPGVRVRAVQPLRGFRLRLAFSDGSLREIDLDPYLHGPIFEPLREDRKLFRAVRIYPEGETIYWPNGADIAPETLYEESDLLQEQMDQNLKSGRRGLTGANPSLSPRAASERTSAARTRHARSRR